MHLQCLIFDPTHVHSSSCCHAVCCAGAFGKVLLVRNRLNQRKYAMKVISKKLIKKKNHLQYMISEKAILTKVLHPFVVSLKFAFQSDTKLFLVMNFLGGGELFFHLKRRGLIREHEARFYAGEMILAIEFLHNMGIVHRDLKPENVLLDRDGHVALTDFGLAKEIGEGSDVRTLCGTSEYMAPEMLVRNGYGKAVDWWSLGALLFEMLAGSPPFTTGKNGSQKDLDRKIISERLSCPPHLTASAHSLLKRLLEKDPSKRLGSAKGTMFCIGGVAALKKHDFFRDIDWDCLYHKAHGDPPIDVSTAIGESEDDDTTHFHEGFTSQCLSPSVVDDSLSPAAHTPSSTCPTTPSRSRCNSFERAFDDFSYSEPGELVVTQRQLEQFEVALQDKIRSQQKKRAKRAKNEELRATRAAAEQMQAAILAAQRAEEEHALQQRRVFDALQTEQRREVDKSKGELEKSQMQWDETNIKVLAAQGNVHDKKRKVKKLTKKIKEIQLLEEKDRTDILSAEQRQKLGRRQEVEDDLVEAEEEEVEASEALENLVLIHKRDLEELEELQKGLDAMRLKHKQELQAFVNKVSCATELQLQDSGTGTGYDDGVKCGDVVFDSVKKSSVCSVLERVPLSDNSEIAMSESIVRTTTTTLLKIPDDMWETVATSKKSQKKKKR